MLKNPIYKEYYIHDKCECYKIKLPYSQYNEHIIVLCKVSEGLTIAKTLALGYIVNHVNAALLLPIE